MNNSSEEFFKIRSNYKMQYPYKYDPKSLDKEIEFRKNINNV